MEPRRQLDTCITCEHPISATTALAQAADDHVEYVNTVLSRETDVHFEHIRQQQLLQS